jgi:hypothetical protein
MLFAISPASRADEPAEGTVPPEYRLSSLTPTGAEAPALPGVSRLGSRPEMLFTLPATFSFDSLTGLNVEDLGNPLDRPRATVRYTWFSNPSWDVKIGLSTTLDPINAWQRFFASTSDRMRVGTFPTMHVAGEGRLADRWMLSINADGLRTARGQGIDMDLRVDYSLTRDLALFGSYRLTDSTGDSQDVYGFLPSNSARFGVRLRF